MADRLIYIPDWDSGNLIPVKLKDNGDGSYSIYTEAAGGGGGGDASAANQTTLNTYVGATTETAPANDTAASGLNGRLQRIAQNITTLISSLISVVGNVAHDAVDSGNPVKIGGKASNTQPTSVTAGDRVEAWFTNSGALQVAAGAGTVSADSSVAATLRLIDSSSAPPGLILFNGASWDRFRGNVYQNSLLSAAARTTTTASSSGTNYNHRGAYFTLKVTAVPGTDTINMQVQFQDGTTNDWITLAETGVKDATGTYNVLVYPGAVDGANKIDAENGVPLPRTYRVNVVHSGSGSFTYSVGAALIL